MRRQLRRFAARTVRSLERLTGSGPYTRAHALEHQLDSARANLRIREAELADVRARRDEVRVRLDHARAELRWLPPHELGWAADEPVRRLVFADSGAPNPLLRLLYHRLVEVGIRPAPKRDPFAAGVAAPDLLHVHWVPDIEIARDRRDAELRVGAWLERLAEAQDLGTTLLRTVHELGGHDQRFGELHNRVDAALLERSHLIHALHRSTVDELVEHRVASRGWCNSVVGRGS